MDYHRELSAQLEWRKNNEDTPIRVVYTSAGEPTAAIIADRDTIIDYKLFWITCKDMQEAHYLLAIINSRTLYEAAQPLMSKGQFGARDLQKHLWKLPIPEYDETNRLHQKIAMAGQAAASEDRPAIAKPLQATRRYGQHDRGSPRIARVARPIGRRQASRDAGKATIGVIRNLWV